MRNAVISRIAFAEPPVFHTSAALSGDDWANDITRWIVEASFDLPGADRLYVFSQHWQSGSGTDEQFRRDVESLRIRRALEGLDLGAASVVVLGDVNHDIDSAPGNPWIALPGGLVPSFRLGADLAALFPTPGILRQPFINLGVDSDLFVVDAAQLDGDPGTGPIGAGGRNRLDYIFLSAPISDLGVASEVYDSEDEGLAGGLVKAGSPLATVTSFDASDHLVVVADVQVPFRILCGDVAITGTIDAADVALLRTALADPAGSLLSQKSEERCPIAGSQPGCDLVDSVVLQRAILDSALLPGLQSYCANNALHEAAR
jgi:hypothetical protein